MKKKEKEEEDEGGGRDSYKCPTGIFAPEF